MRNATISFEYLRNSSDSFPKILNSAKIFDKDDHNQRLHLSKDLSTIEISFRAVGGPSAASGKPSRAWLKVIDIATLALIARTAAEQGTLVNILWPKPNRRDPSSLQKVLSGLGFFQALSNTHKDEQWRNNITFEGHSDIGSGFRNFLPLTWYSSTDFTWNPTDTHPYSIRPSIRRSREDQLREMLISRGFIDSASLQTFTRLIYLELAWNTVIHASDNPLAGYGIVGGQIIQPQDKVIKRPYLSFCICDAGVGIPCRLATQYRKSIGTKTQRNDFCEPSNILKFALNRSSTSKDRHPSKEDELAGRGLHLVTEALRHRGRLNIRSFGGHVDIRPTKADGDQYLGMSLELRDDLKTAPLPGTQLNLIIEQRYEPETTHNKGSFHEKQQIVIPSMQLVALDTSEIGEAATIQDIERKFQSLEQFGALQLIDLGFDDDHRLINYIIREIRRQNPLTTLILFNVATPWESLNPLATEEPIPMVPWLPILLVKRFNDCLILGSSGTAPCESLSLLPDWLKEGSFDCNLDSSMSSYRAILDPRVYMGLARQLNEDFIRRGFSRGDLKQGCYRGKVHLLGAEEPKRKFFSLVKCVKHSTANLLRWKTTCEAALSELLLKSQDQQKSKAEGSGRLVLIGFAGSIRNVVAELAKDSSHENLRAVTLLTFDLPEKEELTTTISKGDNVVLITDVVSSGNLAQCVITTVESIGANIIGIISAVVGRYSQSHKSPEIFQLDGGSLPMVVGANIASLLNTDLPQLEFGEREYWVDPVSLVPVERPVWGWERSIDKRVIHALEILTSSDCVVCGHLVDGSRHSAIHVRLAELIQKDENGHIFQIVVNEIEQRIQERRWESFSPGFMLFPAGIARIERHYAGADNSVTTVYDTAVVHFMALLDKVWKNLRREEVCRAFDPGGGARCASELDFQGDLGNDVIIADDGIWRGTTTRDLINLAIRGGAKRIFVVALLNRLSTNDVEYLESQWSLKVSGESDPVEVCYCLPLLLPVPYTGASASAYEITRQRLADRAMADPWLGKIVDRRLSTLEGKHPSDLGIQDPNYVNYWTKARVYSELASENEAALEALCSLIRHASDEMELLGLFGLFLHEWAILGRGRLRQVVAPLVLDRAREILKNPLTGTDLVKILLSLIRSIFAKDYLSTLHNFIDVRKRVGDLELLEDVLLHLSTLEKKERGKGRIDRAAKELCAAIVIECQEPQTEIAARWKLVLSRLRLMALDQRDRDITIDDLSLPEVASQTLELIREDPHFHHIKGTLNHFGSLDIAHVVPKKLYLVIESLKEWQQDTAPILREHLEPKLSRLAHVLYRSASLQGDFQDISSGLFSRDNSGTITNQFLVRIVDFGSIAEVIEGFPAYAEDLVGDVISCARMLAEEVFERNSRVVTWLLALQKVRLRDLLKLLQEKANEVLGVTVGSVDFQIADGEAFVDNPMLFVPIEVVEIVIENIVVNLREHAFRSDFVQANGRTVRVTAELQSDVEGTAVHVRVMNNGKPIGSQHAQQVGGRSVHEELSLFGGEFPAARKASHPNFEVEQAIIFLTWK